MAYGLRPVRAVGSRNFNGGFLEYPIDADALGTAIYNGACVKLDTTTAVGVQIATPTNSSGDVVGVLVGARWTNSAGEIKFGQSYDGASTNTDAYAYIVPVDGVVFMVEADSAWAESKRGGNFALANPTAGNASTGNSNMALTLGATSAAGAVVVVDVFEDTFRDTTTPNVLVVLRAGAQPTDKNVIG